jgi:MFS family permease
MSEMDQGLASRNDRHNFIVNVVEAALFWLGYSFIAPGVILPVFVSHFTSNNMIIGLIAVISAVGFSFPQLFTANWVESLRYKKDAPVKIGIFTERVPLFLLPGAAALAVIKPLLSVVLTFVLFAWHSIGVGLISVGWQDMIAKVIPQHRRGSYIGISMFAGGTLGVLGAVLSAFVLDRYPFPQGYVICFGIGAVSIFLSWVFLAFTRETPSEVAEVPATHQEYWRNLPQVIKGNPNFVRLLTAQIVITMGGMAWGFVSYFAVQNWKISDGMVGSYNSALLLGQAISTLLLGFIADRTGYKLVQILGITFAILSLLISAIAPDPNWLYLAFFLRGSFFGGMFLTMMFVLEFAQPNNRPTYIGVYSTLIGTISFASPMVGGWIASWAGYQPMFIVAMVFYLVGVLMLIIMVKEPRLPKSVKVRG